MKTRQLEQKVQEGKVRLSARPLCSYRVIGGETSGFDNVIAVSFEFAGRDTDFVGANYFLNGKKIEDIKTRLPRSKPKREYITQSGVFRAPYDSTADTNQEEVCILVNSPKYRGEFERRAKINPDDLPAIQATAKKYLNDLNSEALGKINFRMLEPRHYLERSSPKMKPRINWKNKLKNKFLDIFCPGETFIFLGRQ